MIGAGVNASSLSQLATARHSVKHEAAKYINLSGAERTLEFMQRGVNNESMYFPSL